MSKKPYAPKSVAPPTPTGDSCGNCRCYSPINDDSGHCRYLPGSAVVKEVTMHGPRMALPVKDATDWCGQHKRV